MTLRPRKSLGQNFLVDPNIVRKIVDALEVPAGGRVVEIGPGTGALTGLLLERFPDMTGIEIDERAVGLLRERFPSLDVRREDILDVDWQALSSGIGRPLYIIGNLPYYITSPILFSLFEARTIVRQAVLMMQLEVADRLVAVPQTKAYGILSVVTQLFGEPELLFRVSRNVFVPKPDVTSAVVRINFRADDLPGETDDATLRDVVRTAFNQRRKTLRNSLSRITSAQGLELPDRWSGRRAEELTPVEFLDLARYLGQPDPR